MPLTLKTVITGLLGLAVAAAPRTASTQAKPAEDSHCPDDRAWTGKYENRSYGFSIVIPQGLKGFWNSPACVDGPDGCTCMTDHGRIIPLSSEPYQPERHIEAYAGFATDLDKPTVAQEVSSNLRSIRERSGSHRVTVRARSTIVLAGLKGQRVVARYYDPDLKSWLIEDFIELLRDDVEYSLYLRTRVGLYEHDRPVFDTVVASFALTNEKYGEEYNWKTK